MSNETTIALMQDKIDIEEKEFADCEYRFSKLQDDWNKRMENQKEYLALKGVKIESMKKGLEEFKGDHND